MDVLFNIEIEEPDFRPHCFLLHLCVLGQEGLTESLAVSWIQPQEMQMQEGSFSVIGDRSPSSSHTSLPTFVSLQGKVSLL